MSALSNANRATVMVHGRNELHLSFNNDAELRQAYEELDKITATLAEAPRVEASLRRLLVIRDVNEERKRQDAQWGGPEHDDTHGLHHWVGYLGHQINLFNTYNARERLIKIAALALAAVESMDRKASKPVPPPAERLATLKSEIAEHLAEDADEPTYTTQPGESIRGIALRQLGDEERWGEIYDHNCDRFPHVGQHDYYPVGTVLRMPKKGGAA